LGLFSGKKQETSEDLVEYRKLFESGKFQEALDLLEKRFDKNSPADWYTKGNALNNLQRFQEAAQCYEKAIEIVPDYTKAWYRAGNCLMSLDEYSKAREYFAKATNLERENKTKDEESWESATVFGFMLSYIYEIGQRQQNNSMNEEFTAEADQAVIGAYGQLYEKGVIPKFDQLTDIVEYCNNNMNEILDKIEPNIVIEFRSD